MLIYVVRHGETEYNKEELFRGRKDIPLNEEGGKQAKRLGAYFKGKDIGRIFTSPLVRAQETAQGIKEATKTPIETLDEFTDMDFGAWEGVALRDVQRLYSDQFSLWRETPQRLKVKNGESLAVVRKRIHKGMQRIFLEEGRDCVLVTHRVLCKLIILYAMHVPNSHFWGIKFDPASISIIERKSKDLTVHVVNDTCHLRVGNGSGEYSDF